MSDLNRQIPRSNRRAFTLVEMLIALLISVLLAGSVVSAFMIVLRMAEEREIEFDALQNARHAIEVFSNEIKEVDVNESIVFVGVNTPLGNGNGVDEDGDGTVDEELPNGGDEDGDYSDVHASSGSYDERDHYVGAVDLGDEGVDEDNVFNTDSLTFRVHASVVGYDYDDITYYVSSFEGRDRVLLRNVSRWSGGSEISTTTAPLAFDVMSFNCLYWDPNAAVASQTWVEEWDHTDTFPAPGFEAPAAVYCSITTYADRDPIESYTAGDAIRTITLQTVVCLESVIQDAAFPRDP